MEFLAYRNFQGPIAEPYRSEIGHYRGQPSADSGLQGQRKQGNVRNRVYG